MNANGTGPDALQNVTYAGGRNGAVGPDYFQLELDLRLYLLFLESDQAPAPSPPHAL